VFPLIGNLAALPEAISIAYCVFFNAAVFSGRNPQSPARFLEEISPLPPSLAAFPPLLWQVFVAAGSFLRGIGCGINSIGMIPGNPREIDSSVLILWQGSSKAKSR
jgi:hypothetical protein